MIGPVTMKRMLIATKIIPFTQDGGTMDAGNLYAIMTMLGCLVLTPIALAMEGPKVAGIWNAALSAGYRPHNLIKTGLMSGLFFYL